MYTSTVDDIISSRSVYAMEKKGKLQVWDDLISYKLVKVAQSLI